MRIGDWSSDVCSSNLVGQPTTAQLRWLPRDVDQPGGKLPLFDEWGQRINERTIRSCIDQGWAEPWFTNPLKPDWLVCKLTDAGRTILATHAAPVIKLERRGAASRSHPSRS